MTSPPLTTTQHKGVQRFVAAPLSQSPAVPMRNSTIERDLRKALNAEHMRRIDVERQNDALTAALAAALGSPRRDGWKGRTCDECGCLCKPRETCPMCLWMTYQNEERKTA